MITVSMARLVSVLRSAYFLMAFYLGNVCIDYKHSNWQATHTHTHTHACTHKHTHTHTECRRSFAALGPHAVREHFDVFYSQLRSVTQSFFQPATLTIESLRWPLAHMEVKTFG